MKRIERMGRGVKTGRANWLAARKGEKDPGKRGRRKGLNSITEWAKT